MLLSPGQINSYRENGIAYAMCIAAAQLMRSPHHYLSSVPPGEEGATLQYDGQKRNSPLRDLYDAEGYEREDEGEHQTVSKSTLIAMEQLVRSVERGRRAPPIESLNTYFRKSLNDFVQPPSGEDTINEYLCPKMGYQGWKAFRADERVGRLDLLLYITFREKFKWHPPTGRFSA
jgi:hypothetical protein